MQKTLPVWVKMLKNICLCKLYELTGKYQYPRILLPQKFYRSKIEFDRLASSESICLIRRSEKPADQLFNEIGDLRDDAIDFSEVPKMSMNVMGGKFQLRHLKFHQFKDGSKPWQPRTRVFFIDYKDFYNVLSKVTPIFFRYKDIHQQQFPYYKKKNDDDAKSLIKKGKYEPIVEGDKYKLPGTTEIRHTPNNLNYWHVELYANKVEGTLSSTKTNDQSEMAKYVLTHILKVAAFSEIDENNITPLPLASYSDSCIAQICA